jgi:hypothetical protein
MAVEVYWWAPSLKSATGHAAMMVDGGSPSGPVYLSVSPGSMLSTAFGPAVFNTYAADVADDGIPHVVRLTKLNETAIKAVIKADKGFARYSFLLGNCATQAAFCLNAGLPTAMPHPFINAPWGLYIYAQSLKVLYA